MNGKKADIIRRSKLFVAVSTNISGKRKSTAVVHRLKEGKSEQYTKQNVAQSMNKRHSN